MYPCCVRPSSPPNFCRQGGAKSHRMGSASGITILKAVPAQAGNGWRVFIQWASGRIQYISGFESLQDAEHWIAAEAQNWLNALDARL